MERAGRAGRAGRCGSRPDRVESSYRTSPARSSSASSGAAEKGVTGKRVVRLTKRLAFIHKRGGHAYLDRWYWKFKEPVEQAVRDFQGDFHLEVDTGIAEAAVEPASEATVWSPTGGDCRAMPCCVRT